MTDILFYHLTESRLEDALPPLLEKSLARGWKVVVQAGSEARRDALDNHLWTFREDSFLPHGIDGEANAEMQPVLLAADPDRGNGAANKANVRFIVDGAEPPDLAPYERVVFMFDGHDQPQIEAARAEWTRLKGQGHTLTYWQQTAGGRWEKKA